MVYTGDLKSPAERHAGSSPARGTTWKVIMQKTSYDEMKKLYQQWFSNPEGTQAMFFRSHGWTRADFFDEASRRGDDV